MSSANEIVHLSGEADAEEGHSQRTEDVESVLASESPQIIDRTIGGSNINTLNDSMRTSDNEHSRSAPESYLPEVFSQAVRAGCLTRNVTTQDVF